jgi:hypothetical protein
MLGLIDLAAVNASRARDEANRADAAYTEASRGTSHLTMRNAVISARTGTDKSGKTARLLSEAAEHFTIYINKIAPGTVPTRMSAPEGIPSGEEVLDEARIRRERMAGFLDRTVKKTDDISDTVNSVTKSISDGTKITLQQIKGDSTPPGTTTTSTTPTTVSTPQAANAPEVVSAITVTLLGAAMVGRATLDYIKRKQKENRQDGGK